MRRRFIASVVTSIVLALAAYAFRPIAANDLPRDARALTFYDRHGALLGTILGRDDRHTIAIGLDRMSPDFVAALRATEDRRFVAHGALDPLATVRAFAFAFVRGRAPHGASTLTMQLARTVVPIDATLWGRVVESVVAQRLENGLSKAQILEAYANRAPMGSNVYGVEAAARTYFGVDASDLDLAQAALLAGLPNDPVRLDPTTHLAAARARARTVLARMRAAGVIDAARQTQAARERIALVPRSTGILGAAHLLFDLAPRVAPDRTQVRTTIDLPLQRFVDRQMNDVVASLRSDHVGQAAAVVIDNATGDVLAYAGSLDYFDNAHLGRNDGVRALRAPGSTLKPFLYELALERRTIRPTTVLADAPVAYAMPDAGLYRPADYSGRFQGPVLVRTALANSLNVPAVRVLARVGVSAFLDRLHALGFAHLTRSADDYGLGLTLGGAEVSLFELARAYRSLARGGAASALRTTLDGSVESESAAGASPGDPAWAFVTNVIADRAARAAAFGTNSILALPFAAAVKTGTSSDFRDTWTAGFTRDYTVAVWVGNFDGSAMRGVSGVSGAAPIWSRIMLHLHARHEPLPFAAPRGYERRPLRVRDATVMEYLDARDRAARVSTLETARAYDAWLVWQPERRRGPVRVLFPHDGDRFVADPRARIDVEIAGAERMQVTLDGAPLAGRNGTYPIAFARGRHELVIRTARAQRTLVVEGVAPIARASRGFSLLSPAGLRETW